MSDIAELLQEYRNEVRIASASYFTWKSVNNLASKDSATLQAINKNSRFWVTATHSLQLTLFATLGRLFDSDRRSLSVLSFIAKCKSQISQFTVAALESRRMKESQGIRPPYLNDYLNAAYAPSPSDFDHLTTAAQAYQSIYRQKYEPIRNKVYAHNDFATIGSKAALFSNTNIGEIENILAFLYQVEKVVEEWHLNGRHTTLQSHPLNDEGDIVNDLEALFSKLKTQ